jgi:hypothetical protein
MFMGVAFLFAGAMFLLFPRVFWVSNRLFGAIERHRSNLRKLLRKLPDTSQFPGRERLLVS